ncbi:uncharacterized protein EI90DRAFT_3022658 [Cantharellus anzutake]|uniref:uncharacterized protein n=1 Tax=Cantharellus anzutake TaxID=1750568 RepID=UPI0019083459|nr:uncharacterized protein EI90DRAFT_3022658 [Cantharellus anzutake]KAF8313521.1 hypothetical protein EI90DRAFT_3022658 [Cantharellus anzutake]
MCLSLENMEPTPEATGLMEEGGMPSVFLHLDRDPDSHFHRALPALLSRKRFKYHIDLKAFDDQGLDVPCEAMELFFREGVAVIGTASLHLYVHNPSTSFMGDKWALWMDSMRACNTLRGEIHLFQLHWTALQMAGQTNLLREELINLPSGSKKRPAEEESPELLPKRHPFFTSHMAKKEAALDGTLKDNVTLNGVKGKAVVEVLYMGGVGWRIRMGMEGKCASIFLITLLWG